MRGGGGAPQSEYATPPPPRPGPVRTRRLGPIWLPVPQKTTSPTATLTPLGMDTPPPPPRGLVPTPPPPTHTTPQRLPQQLRQCHSNTDTKNNSGQRRTAQDSPEKTPGAPRALCDVPTDTLQGWVEAADSSLTPTAGTRTKGDQPQSRTLRLTVGATCMVYQSHAS